MSDEVPVTPCRPALVRIPIALYESKRVVFELYHGGRSYEPAERIYWEQLKTFAISREGGLTFHVCVSQAHFGNKPDHERGLSSSRTRAY